MNKPTVFNYSRYEEALEQIEKLTAEKNELLRQIRILSADNKAAYDYIRQLKGELDK